MEESPAPDEMPATEVQQEPRTKSTTILHVRKEDAEWLKSQFPGASTVESFAAFRDALAEPRSQMVSTPCDVMNQCGWRQEKQAYIEQCVAAARMALYDMAAMPPGEFSLLDLIGLLATRALKSETPSPTPGIVTPVVKGEVRWADGSIPCRCDGLEQRGPWHKAGCGNRT